MTHPATNDPEDRGATRPPFVPLDVTSLPHYSRGDLAIASLLDEVDELIGAVDFTEREVSDLTWLDFVNEVPGITGRPAVKGLTDHRELANEVRSIATELTEATAERFDPVRTDHAARRMQTVAAQVEALAEHVDATDTESMRRLALDACRARQAVRGWRVAAVYAALGGAAVTHFAPALIGVVL